VSSHPLQADGIFLGMLVYGVKESLRHISPVCFRVSVVNDVVPVVEAEGVVNNVDTVVREKIVAFWPVGVDKRVLGPVTQHKGEGGHKERDDENLQPNREGRDSLSVTETTQPASYRSSFQLFSNVSG